MHATHLLLYGRNDTPVAPMNGKHDVFYRIDEAV